MKPAPNEEAARYAAAWKEATRSLRRFLAWLLGGAILMALVASIAPARMFDRLFSLVVLVSVVGTLVLMLRHVSFPCPRCGRPFFIKTNGLSGDPFASWCRNCHLPKGAPGPDVPDFVLKRR